jgi:hypothetical protein
MVRRRSMPKTRCRKFLGAEIIFCTAGLSVFNPPGGRAGTRAPALLSSTILECVLHITNKYHWQHLTAPAPPTRRAAPLVALSTAPVSRAGKSRSNLSAELLLRFPRPASLERSCERHRDAVSAALRHIDSCDAVLFKAWRRRRLDTLRHGCRPFALLVCTLSEAGRAHRIGELVCVSGGRSPEVRRHLGPALALGHGWLGVR